MKCPIKLGTRPDWHTSDHDKLWQLEVDFVERCQKACDAVPEFTVVRLVPTRDVAAVWRENGMSTNTDLSVLEANVLRNRAADGFEDDAYSFVLDGRVVAFIRGMEFRRIIAQKLDPADSLRRVLHAYDVIQAEYNGQTV